MKQQTLCLILRYADIAQEKIDASYASLKGFVDKLYLDTSKSNEDIAQAVYDMKNGDGEWWILGRMLKNAGLNMGSDAQMKDPLVTLGYLGDTLFTPVAVITEASVIDSLFGGKLTSALKSVVSKTTSGESSVIISTILVMLLFSGVVLKFYLPLLPFILWTMGILGWLVMLVESMIAAPLWAAAHALPDGDGIIGNRASQGYQLLINVLLRPMLLTLGFFVSIIVMWIISWLFLRGYLSAVEGSLSGASWSGYAGLIGTVVLITIMTVVMMLLVNRSFSMIYETADNVMKWVGGGVSGAGEFKAGGELQSSVGGAMGNTRQAIGEVSKQALKNGGTDNGFDKEKIDAANRGGTNTGNNDPSKQHSDHEQQGAPSITASGGGLGGLGGGAGSSGGSSGSAHDHHQQHGASNTARTSTGA